jgi:serine/threonine protein phosphatase PrpC
VVGVYDGHGSLPDGDSASHRIARRMQAAFASPNGPDAEPAERLSRTLRQAGHEVWTYLSSDESRRGIGTTATVCGAFGRDLHAVHVGDSRLYLLRGDRLTRLSRDDTLVQDLLDTGELTPAEAEAHEHSSIITKAIGQGDGAEHGTITAKIERGDRIILVTDGIWRQVADARIREICRELTDPEAACDALVAAAEAAGGHDNQTAIVVDCVDP